MDLSSHDGLKKRLWKDRAVAGREGKEEGRKVQAFFDGCTLVKVPAFTANDPVFVFIASMRHLSRYFRLTPALNGSIDIPRADVRVYAMCVRAYIKVCIYVYCLVWNAPRICETCSLCLHIISSHRARRVSSRIFLWSKRAKPAISRRRNKIFTFNSIIRLYINFNFRPL